MIFVTEETVESLTKCPIPVVCSLELRLYYAPLMDTLQQLTTRPTHMEVDLKALAHNYKALATYVAPAKVVAVVKANAYGHGLETCSKRLETEGCSYFGVACVEEGIELRNAGITSPILVFGGILGEQINLYLQHNLEITASSVSKLEAIDETARSLGKKAKVHLKIDTGLERIGVHYYSAKPLLEAALKVKHTEIVGIFSHFATADDPNDSFAHEQKRRMEEVLSFFSERQLTRPPVHIANSAATLRGKEFHCDMVRTGIALYGILPASHYQNFLGLKPVMSLKSKVVYFKVIRKGAGVSYGHTWKAPEQTRIVTIPIGYGDGFFRRLSNRGSVLIRGKRYPIVGNVCMDQMMINLGSKGEAYNGDEVVLVGTQGNENITVAEVAELVDTAPHEVLTSTNMRVPRVFIG